MSQAAPYPPEDWRCPTQSSTKTEEPEALRLFCATELSLTDDRRQQFDGAHKEPPRRRDREQQRLPELFSGGQGGRAGRSWGRETGSGED